MTNNSTTVILRGTIGFMGAEVHILHGQEGYSLEQAFDVIKQQVQPPELAQANITCFDGRTLRLAELVNAGAMVPFLAARRLVVIDGLLGRYEPPKGRRGDQGTAPEPSEWQGLPSGIDRMPESTILVFRDGPLSSANRLLRTLAKKASVKPFPLLKAAELASWIRQRVDREGGRISPRAVTLLAGLVGSDLRTMSSEIDKLLLYCSERGVTENEVMALVSHSRQVNIFGLVDAVLGRRKDQAHRELHYLFREGASPGYVLTMVARQVRLIILAKEMSASEMRSKLKLADFAVEKTFAQSQRLTVTQLKEVYARLLRTDVSIKTGKYPGELALDLLVAEMTAR